jgi:hypothetical protein
MLNHHVGMSLEDLVRHGNAIELDLARSPPERCIQTQSTNQYCLYKIRSRKFLLEDLDEYTSPREGSEL